MQQNMFESGDPIRQFFQWNETVWSDLQKASLGDNPVTEALSRVNAEDLKTFYEVVASNPVRLLDMQMQWWQGQLAICQNSMVKAIDRSADSVIADPPGDRRFQHQSWKDDPNFDFLRQSYLHFANSLMQTLEVVEGLPDPVRQRLIFFFRQTINAL